MKGRVARGYFKFGLGCQRDLLIRCLFYSLRVIQLFRVGPDLAGQCSESGPGGAPGLGRHAGPLPRIIPASHSGRVR